MNTVPLATAILPSLGDVVEDALAAALAGRLEACLWCGRSEVAVVSADFWSGRVVLHCHACGSDLSGVVPRRLREVPT